MAGNRLTSLHSLAAWGEIATGHTMPSVDGVESSADFETLRPDSTGENH